jgi:hypothetical protein
MKGVVVWVVKPCSFEGVQRFGEIYPLQLIFPPTYAGFFIGLFDPEDLGDIFLGNFGTSPNYMKSQPKIWYHCVMLYFFIIILR